jgi:hypothetical protein
MLTKLANRAFLPTPIACLPANRDRGDGGPSSPPTRPDTSQLSNMLGTPKKIRRAFGARRFSLSNPR